MIFWVSWKSAILGVLVGAGILLIVNELGLFLRGAAGIGLGDVKMMAMIGAFLGLSGIGLTLFVAAPIAGVVSLVLLGQRQIGGRPALAVRRVPGSWGRSSRSLWDATCLRIVGR